ncbi:MAG: hypothetical protein ACKVQS_07660 [Fimbriimonadaceae bacterium]
MALEILVDNQEFEAEPRGVLLGKAVVGAVFLIVLIGLGMMLARNYREVGDRAASRAMEAAERARVARVVIEKELIEELKVPFGKVEQLEVGDVVSLEVGRAEYVAEFFDGAGQVLVSGSLRGKNLSIAVGRVGFPPMEVKAGLLSQFRACMRKRKTTTKWMGRGFEWSAMDVNMVPASSGKGFAPGYLSKFGWEVGI